MRNSLDSAWLDSQYNNRLRVPDFAQILERWKKAALLAQQSLTSHLDVAFGLAPSDKLDIFPSAQTAGKKAPVLIFIHGVLLQWTGNFPTLRITVAKVTPKREK